MVGRELVFIGDPQHNIWRSGVFSIESNFNKRGLAYNTESIVYFITVGGPNSIAEMCAIYALINKCEKYELNMIIPLPYNGQKNAEFITAFMQSETSFLDMANHLKHKNRKNFYIPYYDGTSMLTNEAINEQESHVYSVVAQCEE